MSTSPTDPGALLFEVAELDRVGRVTTQFTLGVTFLVPAGVGLVSGSVPLFYLTVAISVAVVALSWAMSPTGYELDGQTLHVRRRAWSAWTTSVEGFSRHDDPGRFGVRLGGSGGLFGWYGRFRRSDLGIIRVYVTTREETHVIGLTSSRGVDRHQPGGQTGHGQGTEEGPAMSGAADERHKRDPGDHRRQPLR